MADETVAAPAAPEAPSTPAATPQGAPIETPEGQAPAPIEGQAPEKPKEPEAEVEAPKPKSVRDSVKKADADAKAKAEAKAAEKAKAEEAKPDAEAAKKAEADKPARERGQDGKFVAKDAPKTPEGQQQAPAADQQKPSAYHEPPQRFKSDQAASEEWANAPESVRAATHRVVRELEQGIEKYREDATKYEPVREIDSRLREVGSSYDKVFHGYMQLEQLTRQDPDKGLGIVFENLGLDPVQWARRIVENADRVAQGQPPVQGVPQGGADQTIRKLEQKVDQLTQQLQGMPDRIQQGQQQQQQAQKVHGDVKTFAEAKDASGNPLRPHFFELADEIAELITNGQSLESAYNDALYAAQEKARRFLPPAAQQQNAPAQTRTPDPNAEAQTLIDKGRKSISGAPSGEEPRQRTNSTIRESLRRAAAAAT